MYLSQHRRNEQSLLPKFFLTGWFVFCFTWLLIWLLYYPARHAGFVGDFYRDWLKIITEKSFQDYIKWFRPGTSTVYQFTQILTYGYYKIFGAVPLAWHVLHVTLHAIVCLCTYVFFRRLLLDTGIRSYASISLMVSLLFAISPYNTEVVVHEPCLHYTFGFLLLLLPLIWMQRYFRNARPRYLWWSVLLYIPASYSLEIFYLTPWLVLSLALFYRYALQMDKVILKRTAIFFLLPSLVIFAIHIVVLRAYTGSTMSHGVSSSITVLFDGFCNKVLKYIFHVLFMGRFVVNDTRQLIYHYCESVGTHPLFHVGFVAAFLYVLYKFRKTRPRLKLISLLTIWSLLFIALVSPREFPTGQLVALDRYVYFMTPFIYLAIALLFVGKFRVVGMLLFVAGISVSLYLLIKVNRYWAESQKVVTGLMNSFPATGNKIVLLLNPPENMEGIPMIGSDKHSVFGLSYELMRQKKIAGQLYDVASYNMTAADNGAHVNVLNDSVIKVTLNQWGTWWWFYFHGATSYDNEHFKLDMRDVGHWYELTLHKPADQYLLLYSVGERWKIVDMTKKDVDQN